MTIDANIVIDLLNGDLLIAQAFKTWRASELALFLPTIAETEVLSLSKLTPIERKTIEKFIEENFISIPFDRSIARIAASIRRDYHLKLPDAAIAATAFYTRTPIVTRNVKDFRRITNLEVINIK
ncbi:type II toxin-antitoxin system VapC family toxin [Candidatus Uhrbacteria bacterium]|nr:type II toxin-antitoxin system VapC family toxin [Candidatus Uhrbacteria bacterium]